MIHLRAVLCAGAILAGACGGGSGTDAGQDATGDSGPTFPDLPQLSSFQSMEDSTGTTYTASTIDYSCLGSRTQPMGGAPIASTFRVREFSTHAPYAGPASAPMQIWFFTDNLIHDDCSGSYCQLITTDAMGEAMVQVPTNGWYGYWVQPIARDRVGSDGQTVFSLLQTNEPGPTATGQTLDGRWVSLMTANVITAAAQFARDGGTSILAGVVQDCTGAASRVEGAVVRLFGPNGQEITQGATSHDPQFRYFVEIGTMTFPMPDALSTSQDGLYMVAQLPPLDSGTNYRIEAWGQRMAGGPVERLGCEEARVVPDGITVIDIGPLRSDGPASCR